MTTSASILWTHFFFFAAAAAASASCTRVCVCVSVRTWTCLHPSLPSANRAARARTQRPKRKEGNGIHKSNAWAITMVHASACFGSVRFTSAAFSASASLSFFFVQNVQSHVCAIDSWCLIMCSNSPRSDLLFARKRVRAAVREKAPNCLRCTSRQHA